LGGTCICKTVDDIMTNNDDAISSQTPLEEKINYKVKTLAEIQPLLTQKTEELDQVYTETRLFLVAKQTLEQIDFAQKDFLKHEQDILDLRNSLDIARFSDPLCNREKWKTSRSVCERHISEIRYFHGHLGKKQKDLIQDNKSDDIDVVALLLVLTVIPSAAFTLIKGLPGSNDAFAFFIAMCASLNGARFIMRNKFKKLWKDEAKNITSEHSRLSNDGTALKEEHVKEAPKEAARTVHPYKVRGDEKKP
jgi:hypothetical protein